MYATVPSRVTRPTSIMLEPYEMMLMFSYTGHAEVLALFPGLLGSILNCLLHTARLPLGNEASGASLKTGPM